MPAKYLIRSYTIFCFLNCVERYGDILMHFCSRLHCAVLWKSVLGESFFRYNVVLDKAAFYHHTCSHCVDDIIRTLRMSGSGIYGGNIFAGCILYDDGILRVEEYISPTPFVDFLCCQFRRSLLWTFAFSICRHFSKLWIAILIIPFTADSTRIRLPYVENLRMGHSPNPEKSGLSI